MASAAAAAVTKPVVPVAATSARYYLEFSAAVEFVPSCRNGRSFLGHTAASSSAVTDQQVLICTDGQKFMWPTSSTSSRAALFNLRDKVQAVLPSSATVWRMCQVRNCDGSGSPHLAVLLRHNIEDSAELQRAGFHTLFMQIVCNVPGICARFFLRGSCRTTSQPCPHSHSTPDLIHAVATRTSSKKLSDESLFALHASVKHGQNRTVVQRSSEPPPPPPPGHASGSANNPVVVVDAPSKMSTPAPAPSTQTVLPHQAEPVAQAQQPPPILLPQITVAAPVMCAPSIPHAALPVLARYHKLTSRHRVCKFGPSLDLQASGAAAAANAVSMFSASDPVGFPGSVFVWYDVSVTLEITAGETEEQRLMRLVPRFQDAISRLLDYRVVVRRVSNVIGPPQRAVAFAIQKVTNTTSTLWEPLDQGIDGDLMHKLCKSYIKTLRSWLVGSLGYAACAEFASVRRQCSRGDMCKFSHDIERIERDLSAIESRMDGEATPRTSASIRVSSPSSSSSQRAESHRRPRSRSRSRSSEKQRRLPRSRSRSRDRDHQRPAHCEFRVALFPALIFDDAGRFPRCPLVRDISLPNGMEHSSLVWMDVPTPHSNAIGEWASGDAFFTDLKEAYRTLLARKALLPQDRVLWMARAVPHDTDRQKPPPLVLQFANDRVTPKQRGTNQVFSWTEFAFYDLENYRKPDRKEPKLCSLHFLDGFCNDGGCRRSHSGRSVLETRRDQALDRMSGVYAWTQHRQKLQDSLEQAAAART